MPKLQNLYCWCLGIIFLFSLPVALADLENLIINEVMYNPKGSDTDAEWIELYNPGNILIDFYDDALFIGDDKYKQKIEDYAGQIWETNATYFLITSCFSSFYEDEELWDILLNPISLNLFDDNDEPRCDKIGNNLKNSEDYIELQYCGCAKLDENNCEENNCFWNGNNCEDVDCLQFSTGYGGNESSCLEAYGGDICIWDAEYEEECDAIYHVECELIDFLWYNSSTVYYDDIYFDADAYGNDKSLQLINGSWVEAEPTPGYANEIVEPLPPQKEITLKVNTDVFLFNNLNYTSLFKIRIKNKENCSDKENITIEYDIYDVWNEEYIKEANFTIPVGCTKTSGTGNIYFEDTGEYTICGYVLNETNITDCLDIEVLDTSTIPCNLSLEIDNSKEIYELPEKIKFKPLLSDKTYPYKIDYWFEDLFGNMIRKKITTLNTNRKSWKPKIDESDKVFLIKTNLSFISCNDTNSTDNSAEQIVIVKDPDYSENLPENESYVKIVDISLGSDNKAKFGEAVDVKVNIYRGDTSKYSISLWAEGISKISSKTTKIHTLTRFINYTFTVPVQLKPNCNEKYDDGNYNIKLEGLDSSDSASIKVEGLTSSLCSGSSTSSSTSSKQKFSFSIISLPDEIEAGKEFTSKVKITSDDDEHIIDIWSYVYRGSKCYSGDREANIQSITLPEDSSVIVDLKNIVTGAEPGDYNFKVKLRKDNQKTLKQLTEEITLADPETSSTQLSETNINQQAFSSSNLAEQTCSESILIYESSSEKTKRWVIWMLLGALFLLNVFLIWRK